ncbi:MAG: HEAT repeat domain-containing protein [Myxococcaceae bacterium]
MRFWCQSGLLFVLAVATSCQREAHFWVEEVRVVPGTAVAASDLEMDEAGLEEMLRQKAGQNGRFQFSAKPSTPGVRLVLEMATARSEIARSQAPEVEVAAVMEVHRRKGENTSKFRVDASSRQAYAEDGGQPARRHAAREALGRVVEQLLRATEAELAAREFTDRVLVERLSATDVIVADAAMHVLVERRHPAAVPALLRRLTSRDDVVVRRAIGHLVDLKDVRAVPGLIELSRGRHSGLEREIVSALEEIGGDEARAYLYTLSQGHDLAHIREAARAAFDTLTARQARRNP